MKTKLVLSTAAGVRAPEFPARAEKELARVRRAAETCAERAAYLESERHGDGARLLWSRVAALKSAIAELRREMELSGLIHGGAH